MSSINESNFSSDRRLPLRAGLWLAQLLLAGAYLSIGIAVLVLPVTQILAIAPWAGHMPAVLLKFVGGVDLAADLGVLLPSVTRIAPGMTALAAVCSAALQGLAILFNVLLGVLPTPFSVNLAVFSLSLAVFALSVFVAWARSGEALIAPWRENRRMSDVGLFVRDQAGGSASRLKDRRLVMVQALENPGHEVSRTQQGLRDAPFIAQSGKSHGKKAA